MKVKILLLVAFIVCVGYWFVPKITQTPKNTGATSSQNSELAQLLSIADRSFIPVRVGGIDLTVEVVNTAESVTLGLSGRESIGADGMLFVFPRSGELRFWMRDMLFDLDMVWINDLTVIDISRNVPKPTSATSVLPTYSPKSPASLVLEIPAGKAAEWNIIEGSKLSILGL